ncbi:MAG TPA: Hpt domain-containing protein [Syntrophaceae bacterium]|jgi:HPt (histidine-containing phosphotransfer) domain-containing protein|nr:Hpt domain-containing protein [Smithellaceae bacterium]HBJ75208.1 Hpt domain-containing protein [Syntrophaceae bacterium]HCX01774.1 Hpt domain-containing protein [Syntrophaceae bacterium]
MAEKERDSQQRKFTAIVDEDLRDLIPGYLENRRKDIKDIHAALDRNDFEVIRALGHKMKGSGGGYGFDEITEIGRACEEAAKQSQAQEIREQVHRLQDYIDNVAIIFQP